MHSVQHKVLDILGHYTGSGEALTPHTRLRSVGVDSLSLIQVGLELEEEFGSKAYMGSSDLGRIHTIQDLIDFIQRP